MKEDVVPDFWRGQRVFVTGHTGFKGGWLALWMRAMGAEVTGLADGVPTEPSLLALAGVQRDVRDVRADVRDAATVARATADAHPERVLHLAAQPLVRPSFSQPRLTYEVTVMGTVNVLEAVRATGGVRVVLIVTSDKCDDNREWEWRDDESMDGHDPDSSSKVASGVVTSAWRRSFISSEDVPRLASARAGNVVGGGDRSADRLIPEVMRAALAGKRVRVCNPGATRPWQHVLKPLSGYLLLTQRLWDDPAAATAWNLGPGENDVHSVGYLLERLAALSPGEIKWKQDAGEQPHEARYRSVDSSRARTRLGWAPRWGLKRALESVVELCAAHRARGDMRAVSLAQLAGFQEDAR